MIANREQGTAPNVPPPPDMQKEPALTLGKIFADKAMIKTYVAAILGILATGMRFAVDDQLVENIATVVQLLAVIATPFIAQFENGQRAQQQAEVTRDSVYAPATVGAIAQKAADTGVVPKSEWGVNNLDEYGSRDYM